MQVLVADAFETSGLEGLKNIGCTVTYSPTLSGESLVEALRQSGAEVLIVRSTQVTANMLEAGRLTLVVRAGAGVNTIDVKAASRLGIYVANCPGKNAIAVAELATGLLLSLDRQIPEATAELKAGVWNKKKYSSGAGLFGKTLGLLGMGAIGKELIRRAHGLGMHVVAWTLGYEDLDRPLTLEESRKEELDLRYPELGVHMAPTPEAVAARCDVLSLHLPLTSSTRGMVGESIFAAMKPGAFFLNTARAELVDSSALENAIRTKGLRVGLDVFHQEPSTGTGSFVDPVMGLPGVVGTHHIGASTQQAQEAIAAETVAIVQAFVETGKVPNVVNLAQNTPAHYLLVARTLDKPGVLAHLFEHLRSAHINVQEAENIIFDGAEAAVARIHLDVAPSASLLEQMRLGNPHILDLKLVGLK